LNDNAVTVFGVQYDVHEGVGCNLFCGRAKEEKFSQFLLTVEVKVINIRTCINHSRGHGAPHEVLKGESRGNKLDKLSRRSGERERTPLVKTRGIVGLHVGGESH
jgi:hypothetical protein